MSHRFAIRIAHRDVASEPYSVTVESQKTRKMLLNSYSNLMFLANVESVSELRKNYTKLMDARGSMSFCSKDKASDDAHLLAVTEDESVGELRNCKIYRIWGVNAISLKRPTTSYPTDPRINDVSYKISFNCSQLKSFQFFRVSYGRLRFKDHHLNFEAAMTAIRKIVLIFRMTGSIRLFSFLLRSRPS
ncbi:unnamed protein product [Brugia timori]|uniref:Uncharacterized protein n=1 Tax=Brugia timori TaxID=42155 RepID=A0A0R3RA51_9BILA|nr:unnamed protein product [Brugia timori]